MANNKRYTAKELELMQWGIIDKEIKEAEKSGNRLSRRFVLDALLNEHNLKEGDTFLFTDPHPAGGTWTFRVQKGDKPFSFGHCRGYHVWGIRNEAWECGTHATFSAGYETLEEMFLDCLNDHNRNGAIKNRYADLDTWLYPYGDRDYPYHEIS